MDTDNTKPGPETPPAAVGGMQELIARHPFLDGVDPQHLPLLAVGALPVCFVPGQIIAREGDEATHFYLILKGRIALEALIPAQGQVKFQTIGTGEALGWSWLFPPFRWHFSARALEEAEAVQLETARLRAAADANPKFGYELARRLTSVLLQRLQATNLQLRDFYGRPN
jgi:CRP-like cAMP-binding protein